jgi:outer membrane biosynthesis protein TonB
MVAETIASTMPIRIGRLTKIQGIDKKILWGGIASVVLIAGVGFSILQFAGSNTNTQKALPPPLPQVPVVDQPIPSPPTQEPPAPMPVTPPAQTSPNTSTAAPISKPIPPQEGGKLKRIQDHLAVARLFQERGEYADARKELEKARALDPESARILAELEKVKKACEAEKHILGNANLKC